MTLKKKKKIAQIIIDNNGTSQELVAKVKELLNKQKEW